MSSSYPAEGLPAVDERLVAAESGYEVIDGRVIEVRGAGEAHGTRHAKVAALIEAAVSDGKVILSFDASLLANAERFRFATSSEYGRYETIGTELMARDDAPDNDQPARFPG